MALHNTLLYLGRKNLLQELFLQTRGLHKTVASGSVDIAHSPADLNEDTVKPSEEVLDVANAKSLKEMPGPSTIANLIEFFYRDGFSRIHEIQVPKFTITR